MKKFFRTHPELIYLNSGSHSLVPLSVIQEVKAELDLYEQNPTAGMFQAWQKLWSVQKQIAPHFGANPKNFFFRANVTQPFPGLTQIKDTQSWGRYQITPHD